MVDKKRVLKVAELARLHVSEDKASQYQEQFVKILDYFNKIQKVACEQIDPMLTPIAEPGFMREDKVDNPCTVDEILQNAPDSKGQLFKVPPVV